MDFTIKLQDFGDSYLASIDDRLIVVEARTLEELFKELLISIKLSERLNDE